MEAYQPHGFGDPRFPSPPPPHPPPPPYPHHFSQPQLHQPGNYPPIHYHHHHHHPQPLPPYPQQHPWPHPEGRHLLPMPPPPPTHLQYQQQYPAAAPAPPPYDAPMPPLPPHLHPHHHYPPPPHLGPSAAPPNGHHLRSPSPPPSAGYPLAPNQDLQGWAHYQGREYPEKNYTYKTEDDWAARAKAWASAKSATENHPVHSQMPVRRGEEHAFAHYEQNQPATGPSADPSQPSIQHQSFYMMDRQEQANHLHVSVPYNSGPTTYSTDGHSHFTADGEATAAHKDHLSPAKSYGSNSSVYNQEVPCNYSSIPGNREDDIQNASLQQPLSFQVQEGFAHLQSSEPSKHVSMEQPSYTQSLQSNNLFPGVSNEPLNFEPRSSSDFNVHPKVNYGHGDSSGGMILMDHDTVSSSLNAWTPSAASGGFPQPLAPSGTQFDPPFVAPSLPLQNGPVFGISPGASFAPNLQPSSAHFGFATGEPVNQPMGYCPDGNNVLGISERPKKAAVPKWLQEEIIKNRAVIATTYANHQAGNSYDPHADEDTVKPFRAVDQDEGKSADSTKSTEDDEDDEDTVEAARSAAINKEIKRILTEVLLKVTDEFFNEIATKVLNEDDIPVEETKANVKNYKVPPPPTPKIFSKVQSPVKESNKTVIGVSTKSTSPPLGGNILGLGTYASDEEEDDEFGDDNRAQSSHMPILDTIVQGNNGRSFGVDPKAGIGGISLVKDEHSGVLHNIKTKQEEVHWVDKSENHGIRNHPLNMRQNASSSDELHDDKALKVSSDLGDMPKSNKSNFSNNNADTNSGVELEIAKSAIQEDHVRESKNTIASKYPVRSFGKDSVYNTVDDKDTKVSDSIKPIYRESTTKLKDNVEKTVQSKEDQNRNASRAEESDSRRTKGVVKDSRRETMKDEHENYREYSERKKLKVMDEKEERSRHTKRDTSKYSSKRSPSPKGRISREYGHGGISSNEPSQSSKKRQVSRSPNRKHSHRRHSPYSSTSRRRRSRSPDH